MLEGVTSEEQCRESEATTSSRATPVTPVRPFQGGIYHSGYGMYPMFQAPAPLPFMPPPPSHYYGGPSHTYSPPSHTYSPPSHIYSPPSHIYSPPSHIYSPPSIQMNTVPEMTRFRNPVPYVQEPREMPRPYYPRKRPLGLDLPPPSSSSTTYFDRSLAEYELMRRMTAATPRPTTAETTSEGELSTPSSGKKQKRSEVHSLQSPSQPLCMKQEERGLDLRCDPRSRVGTSGHSDPPTTASALQHRVPTIAERERDTRSAFEDKILGTRFEQSDRDAEPSHGGDTVIDLSVSGAGSARRRREDDNVAIKLESLDQRFGRFAPGSDPTAEPSDPVFSTDGPGCSRTVVRISSEGGLREEVSSSETAVEIKSELWNVSRSSGLPPLSYLGSSNAFAMDELMGSRVEGPAISAVEDVRGNDSRFDLPARWPPLGSCGNQFQSDAESSLNLGTSSFDFSNPLGVKREQAAISAAVPTVTRTQDVELNLSAGAGVSRASDNEYRLPPVGFEILRDPMTGKVLLVPATNIEALHRALFWPEYQPAALLPVSSPATEKTAAVVKEESSAVRGSSVADSGVQVAASKRTDQGSGMVVAKPTRIPKTRNWLLENPVKKERETPVTWVPPVDVSGLELLSQGIEKIESRPVPISGFGLLCALAEQRIEDEDYRLDDETRRDEGEANLPVPMDEPAAESVMSTSRPEMSPPVLERATDVPTAEESQTERAKFDPPTLSPPDAEQMEKMASRKDQVESGRGESERREAGERSEVQVARSSSSPTPRLRQHPVPGPQLGVGPSSSSRTSPGSSPSAAGSDVASRPTSGGLTRGNRLVRDPKDGTCAEDDVSCGCATGSCVLTTEDLLTDSFPIRILAIDAGLLYTGQLSAIQPPDVYGITIDGERGNRPHIYSREEILNNSILEIRPTSAFDLPPGTRVCAYWSGQYRCLYPGFVSSTSPQDAKPDSVYVDFDDGDSCRINVRDIRLLPKDYPVVEPIPDPLLNPPRKKRRPAGKKPAKGDETAEESAEPEPGPSGISRTRTRSEVEVRVGDPYTAALALRDVPACEVLASGSSGGALPTPGGATSPREQEPEPEAGPSGDPAWLERKLLRKKRREERRRKREASEGSAERRKKKHKKHRHKHRHKREGSSRGSEGSASSSAERPGPSQPRRSARRRAEGQEVAQAGPAPVPRRWGWSGRGYRRAGAKGKARKEYYRAIQRGAERIVIGECAVFISTGRPDRPFIGRIESMWETWGANMVVRVKWFYHPEETVGCPATLEYPGALFESSHSDDNDVQTISHKCEVVPLKRYIEILGKGARKCGGSTTLFYLAGFYDPTNTSLQFQEGVK